MKKLLTLYLVFSIYFLAAQIQNEPGTIILDTGDSITGSISMYNDLNFEVLYTDSSNIQQSCSLNCVDEIAMQNGMNFTTIHESDDTSNRIFVQKILIAPKMNLYSHITGGNKYYYVTKDGISYRMVLELREIEKDGKRYQYYDKKYIGTLKYLMADRPDLFSEIDKLGLTQVSLIKLLKDYNNDNIIYTYSPEEIERLPQSKPNFVAIFQYSNIASAPWDGPVSRYSYGYSAGIQMYFTRGKRHSFKINAGYWKYNLKATKQLATTTYDYSYIDEFYGITFTYEFDFIITPKTNVYVNAIIADMGYHKELNYQNSGVT